MLGGDPPDITSAYYFYKKPGHAANGAKNFAQNGVRTGISTMIMECIFALRFPLFCVKLFSVSSSMHTRLLKTMNKCLRKF